MSFNPKELFTKERADLSNFLIHLTKNGSFDYFEPYQKRPGHYVFNDSATLDAEDSLHSILENTALLARAPFGYFKFGINTGNFVRKNIPLDWLQCVCFSEAPLRELKSFYKATQNPDLAAIKANKYQKYGIAFHTEFIRSRGGHPLFYFDSRRKDILAAIDQLTVPTIMPEVKSTLPLYEKFGPKTETDRSEVDFRWEREWRMVGSFSFELADVAFGLCPAEKIEKFSAQVKNSFPFIDPDWDIEVIREFLVKNSWTDLSDAI